MDLEWTNDRLGYAVPFRVGVVPDPDAAVSHAVPHTVLPRLLWPMAAAAVPPGSIKIPMLRDAHHCITAMILPGDPPSEPAIALPDCARKEDPQDEDKGEESRAKTESAGSYPLPLAYAAQLPQLTRLTIRGPRVSDAVFAFVSTRLLDLRDLRLECCDPLPASSIEQLVKLPRLQSLSFENCGVDAAGLEVVAAAAKNSLESLELSLCDNVSAATLVPVAALVNVTSFSLCGARLCSSSSSLAPLASLVKLESLDLRHSEFYCHVPDPFAPLRQLPQLRRLQFASSRVVDHQTLAPLASLESLEELELSHCPRINAAALAHIKGLRHLQSLDLVGCHGVDEAALRVVGAVTSLRTLRLRDCPEISQPPGLVALCDLTGLVSLDVSWCGLSGDFALAPLAKMAALRELHVGGNDQLDSTALSCLPVFPSLAILGADSCPKIDGAALSRIAACSKLRSVCLNGCGKVTSETVKVLATSRSLMTLQARGCIDAVTMAELQKVIPFIEVLV